MKGTRFRRVPLALVAAVLAVSGFAHGAQSSGAAPNAPGPVPGDTAIAADTIVVRVVSSAECVNTPPTMKMIEVAARELNLRVEVTRQIARTMEEAIQYRFFGSPTVQVDGLDLEEERRTSTNYTLS
jgi:hypothetical protein